MQEVTLVKGNLARKIPSIVRNCDICGAREEFDLHVFLACPFAKKVWETGGVECIFLANRFRSTRDRMEGAMASVNQVDLGRFVATTS